MKRKHVNTLHRIFQLFISTDIECKLLGLNLLKVHPIWANLNKHFKVKVHISNRYKMMPNLTYSYYSQSKILRKSLIDELLQIDYSDSENVDRLNKGLILILNYLNECSNHKSRFCYHGARFTDSYYKEYQSVSKAPKRYFYKQKVKNNESKHRPIRQRFTVANIRRSDFLRLRKVFGKDWIFDFTVRRFHFR